MRRGKSQVIYRYLPGMIVDYDDGNCIAKISQWDSREINNVNKKRIIENILSNINKYGNPGIFRGKSDSSFVVLEPHRAIEATLFPLSLICSNPNCKRVHSYFSARQFKAKTKGRFTCEQCQSSLKQMDLIYRHKCGFVGQISLPFHDDCKDPWTQMRLVRAKSGLGEDRWVCGFCGHEISLNRRCADCGTFMKAVPFRQNDVFMAKGFSLINIHSIDENKLFLDPEAGKMIIGEYLGIIPQGLHATDLMESMSPNLVRLKQDFDKELEKWKKMGLTTEQINSIMESSIFKKSEIVKLESRKTVSDFLNDNLTKNDHINTVSSGVLEFLEAIKLHNKTSVNDVIKEAEIRRSPLLEKVKKFPSLLKKVGVENAYVLGDLSIVKCVYGYTREIDEGKDATLMSFKPDKDFEGKIPVYVNKTDTEAILLEFDRTAILKWLKENGEITKVPDDDVSMKLWFLNNVKLDKIIRLSEIPETERVTKIIYTLIHSISHSLLKKASTQCGLDANSLGEIIFPNVPAIIIFSNNSSSFQLGGLFTLFESKIRPWIDMALQDIENCIYDPICKGDIGACHACLYTNEISCENFNGELCRSLLIGGKFLNKNFKGFWSTNSVGDIK